ncbi:bifunctional DNA primase/polymerase [Anaerobaca lacustris]|uniref:Bifunctional DNA primase/polymerase n=1 Tax=Anaerobaca lacustris TaxID=3044600 RepID=A0AAW6U5T0_9BACT|nr:bifunctional DNA primase/polymerase [Sedimentisphaerales bacterium M17dextr]
MGQECTLLRCARYYADRLGWCIIPVPGDQKQARIKWGRYQKARPEPKQIQRWFGNGQALNMAVVLGPVSGGLTCRDFDVPGSYMAWTKTHPDLAGLLPTVRTGKGYHVYCHSDWDSIKHLGDGELRGGRGYCMLPPSVHPDGPAYEWIIRPTAENLVAVDPERAGFLANGEHVTENTEKSEQTEQTEAIVWGEYVEEAIRETLPREYGTRNRKVFEFARTLKSLPQFADADPRELREILKIWHSRARPNIRTREFSETWIDFLKAWPRVRYAKGKEPMMEAFRKAVEGEPPRIAVMKYPDSRTLQTFVSLCRQLQRAAGHQPFYLSCRTAGKLFNVSHMQANRWLFVLVADEILQEIEKGGTQKNPRNATRFRYIGD